MFVLLGSLAACRSDGPVADHATASTPQATYAALRRAEESGAWGDVLRHVLPERRALVAYVTWFGAGYESIGKTPSVLEQYRGLMARHDLDEQWLSKSGTGPGVLEGLANAALGDRPLEPLFADFTAFTAALHPQEAVFGMQGDPEWQVDDEVAVATLADMTFTFVRKDRTWYWAFFDWPELATNDPGA